MMKVFTICCIPVVFMIIFGVCAAAPVKKYPQVPSAQALDFMKKYGYLTDDSDENSDALYTEEGLSEIVKMVQKYGAIPQTGIIDNATLALMTSRRCGVPDIIRKTRAKRYILGPTAWHKRRLTYFIANWSPRLGEYAVTKNIQLALDTWGKYGRLTFHRSPTPEADIIVQFSRGQHGDMFPFDGNGGVLAHAYFPNEGIGGDIHFDEDEPWTDKKGDSDDTDFYTVALHELGHSLGVAHSADQNSIMFPYYSGYDENNEIKLNYDDILAMYELYIRRRLDEDDNTEWQDTYTPESTTVTSRPRRTRPTQSTTTTDRYRKEVETTPYYPRTRPPTRTTEYTPRTERTTPYYPRTRWTIRTSTYRTTEYTTPSERTSSTYYYPSTESSSWSPLDNNNTVLYEGDTESVDDHMKHDRRHDLPTHNSPSLPHICSGHFDAVATLRGELFIFKDEYIWRLRERTRIEPGYPVKLKDMFPDLPKEIKKIDAAYQRPDGMIVLFTGNKFWVYDGKSFVENSPQPLSRYGLPETLDSIDAVQTWGRNHKTYFYKSDRFWRYNETSKLMDPGYPRHMDVWQRVPQNLDAATTWKDGVTYFFKGNMFWTLDNDWVITTDNSPLPAAQWWLGCEEDVEYMKRIYP